MSAPENNLPVEPEELWTKVAAEDIVEEIKVNMAANPLALMIGMVLYQQIPVEKAFAGPAVKKFSRSIIRPTRKTTAPTC